MGLKRPRTFAIDSKKARVCGNFTRSYANFGHQNAKTFKKTSGKSTPLAQTMMFGSTILVSVGLLLTDNDVNKFSSAFSELFNQKMVYKDANNLLDLYEVGKIIGEGTFAVVKIGKNKRNGSSVAIKQVKKELSDQQALENEVNILKIIGKHENIISLIDVYDSKDYLFIITDLADGGELFDKIIEHGELSEQMASKMVKDAMSGLKHLHDLDIIHLDLKPENLLLSGDKIKIADFGLAIKLPGPEFNYVRTECVGTPAYWAPELVKNEAFGKSVDVWSLGCVLYIILCGCHPFDPYGDASESEILAKVVNGHYDQNSSQYVQISPQAKDLIAHMLDPDPERRYTVARVLKHPWLSEAEQILSAKPLPLNHMTKLKAFRAVQLMRMGLSVQTGQTGDDVDGCVKMFSSFDSNKDGVLSRSELAEALKRIGVSFNSKEMDELFKLFEANENGIITIKNFQNAILNFNIDDFEHDKFKTLRAKNKLQHIKYLFDTLDKNGDGYIEQEDCIHLMDSLGYPENKNKLFQKLQSFKTKSNGNIINENQQEFRIDFAEFVRFFRQMEKNKSHVSIEKKRMTARRTVTAKTKSGQRQRTYVG